MKQINDVTIEGYTTQGFYPMEMAANGKNVFKFTIAHNHTLSAAKREEGKQPDASFVTVETWGPLAELASSIIRSKGMPVIVKGYLKQDRWDDQDGKKRERWKVVATDLRVIAPFRSSAVDNAEHESEKAF